MKVLLILLLLSVTALNAYVVLTNSSLPSNLSLNISQSFSSHNATDGLRSTHITLHRNTKNQSAAAAASWNRTVSAIPSGICYREVATATLIDDIGTIGNGSKPTLSRVQFCCDGFRQHPTMRMRCQPICSNGCTNGICVAPNKCQCLPDHVEAVMPGVCLATCPIACSNGTCSTSGDVDGRSVCICNAGYQLHSSGKFCEPSCSKGCTNGKCTAPERCDCDAGYLESIDGPSIGKCAPVCSGGCEFGECLAPERCECRKGYALDAMNVCLPVCTKGCANGRCVAPDQCGCDAGWSLDSAGTVCRPVCERSCLAGKCVAPNKCGCADGYELAANDAFKCLPTCANGCPNGVCTAPGMCLCERGYVKDRKGEDRQLCVKQV